MNTDYGFKVKIKLYFVAACAHIFSPRSLETTRILTLIYQRAGFEITRYFDHHFVWCTDIYVFVLQ